MRGLIVTLLFLMSLSSNARHWEATKELPYELRALIASMNIDYLTKEENSTLKTTLYILDALVKDLPQSDRYFLGKTSLYKWLLQASSTIRLPESFVLKNNLQVKNYADLSPFSKWLFGAIKADIAQIAQDPTYQRYIGEKSKNNFTSSTRTIRRKIKLIAPWAYLLSQKDPLQINLQLMRHQMELLLDVTEQYKIYYRFNSLTPPPKSKTLTFFNYKKEPKKAKEPNQDNETLSYLDSVIKKHKEKGLPLPQNEWTLAPKDTWTPGDGPGIDIKVETDGSYVEPKSLPDPVDDWILDY